MGGNQPGGDGKDDKDKKVRTPNLHRLLIFIDMAALSFERYLEADNSISRRRSPSMNHRHSQPLASGDESVRLLDQTPPPSCPQYIPRHGAS